LTGSPRSKGHLRAPATFVQEGSESATSCTKVGADRAPAAGTRRNRAELNHMSPRRQVSADRQTSVTGPATMDPDPLSAVAEVDALDRQRVRTLVGLAIARIGPRANTAVSTVLLTLLVASRTNTALGITFALTSHRLLSWLTYPFIGRRSDRTATRTGRRVPFMAAGLIGMGVCTWMYTVGHSYWFLVAMIVCAKQASAAFTVTSISVVPEAFGRSRWVKALVVITVAGSIVSLVIKGTVVMTWQRNDPDSWNLAFQMAAVFMVVAGLLVLALVREQKSSIERAAKFRHHQGVRDELAEILRVPNARVLITGLALFSAGLGVTTRLGVVYFDKVLHAGGSAQTVAGFVAGPLGALTGLPFGYLLNRVLRRKQIAILAPAVGSLCFFAHLFIHHLWQSVVLGLIGAPFIVAYVIALAPMLLQLLPRSGGMGERIGLLVAPFSLCTVAFTYAAAALVDGTGDYRTIWLFPAVAGLLHSAVMFKLWVPPGHEHTQLASRLGELRQAIRDQTKSRLLGGTVERDDTDASVAFDAARRILGNPYENV
jgi:maltose/moltooligosaccharide transporter